MLTLRLALRSLRRNLRRTIITVVAISMGLAMLIFSSGFADGVHGQMIESGIKAMAGHVVIQGEGWQKKREAEIVVPDSPDITRRLAAALPDAVVVQRIFLQGLLTSPTGAVGVALSAVQPELEAQVDDLDDKLIEGTYLDGTAQGIVLGVALAKTLGVGIGDKVVLMAQHAGDIESRLFRVVGIFEYGIDEVDAFTAQIPLAAAQEMLSLGDDVTQVSAHIDTYRHTHRAAEVTREAFAGTAGIEVLSWGEALPDLKEWVAYDDAGLYFMILIVAIIVAMGILNTVLMSVLERMREFGVMLSLGSAPGRLALLVMSEATVLGGVSVAIGVGLGLAFNAILATTGLDMSSMGDSMEAAGVAVEMVMYPDLSPGKVVVFAAVTFVMTLLSALYPAWKAATLKPIECLQHR